MTLLTLDSIKVGASYSEELLFDDERIGGFINVSGDKAGIHTNKGFSESKGFDGLVVHGILISIPFSRILGMELPGENTVIGTLTLKFHAPVYFEDTVKYTVTVKRILYPLGSVVLDLKVEKMNGVTCVEGSTICVFKKKEE